LLLMKTCLVVHLVDDAFDVGALTLPCRDSSSELLSSLKEDSGLLSLVGSSWSSGTASVLAGETRRSRVLTIGAGEGCAALAVTWLVVLPGVAWFLTSAEESVVLGGRTDADDDRMEESDEKAELGAFRLIPAEGGASYVATCRARGSLASGVEREGLPLTPLWA